MTHKNHLFIVILLAASFQNWSPAQSDPVASIQTIEGMIAEEFRQFGVAVQGNDLTTIRRWMGEEFLREMETLQQSNASTSRRYLAWNKMAIQIKAANPPGAIKIIKAGIDHTNAGFTVHSLSTIMLLESASESVQNFIGNTGNIFAVAGYIVAIDNFCDVWSANGDMTLATYKLVLATAGMAFTAAGFLFPGFGSAIGAVATTVTFFFDWVATSAYSGQMMYYNLQFDRMMMEFRKDADRIDWVGLFKSGGFKGMLQRLRQEWADTSWRNRLDEDARKILVNYKDELDPKGIETYFKGDIVPTLQGWVKSEVAHAQRVTAEKVHDYLTDLMNQRVRIHIRPTYVDFKGNPLQIRPMVTVHDQTIPYQPNSFMEKRREDIDQPHIDLVIKAGHKKLDITKTHITQAGTDIQIVIPMKHFLRMMSESDNHLDVDATLIRPDAPMPEMELPVFPFPLRLDDLNDWYRFGLEISREGDQTHIGIIGGTRIVIPKVNVQVKVINSKGQTVGGTLNGVGIDDDGTARLEIPSAGQTWIGFAGVDHGTTGDGVVIDGGQITPLNASPKSVTLTVASGATNGRPNLPNLPPLPRMEVNGDLQDANTAITQLESRSITYDEASRIYSEAKSRVQTAIDNAEDQWDSYQSALTKRLHASEVPQSEIQRTVDQRRDTLQKQLTSAKETQLAVDERMRKAIDDILKENQDRRMSIKSALDNCLKPNSELNAMRKDLSRALNVANAMARPRTFEQLADIEADRKTLAQHISVVDAMRGNLNDRLTVLKAATDRLNLELEQYGDFLLTPGSHLRLGYDFQAFQTAAAQALSFETMGAAIQAILDTDTCDTTKNALQRVDGILSWLQLKSVAQIKKAEEFDQLLASAPAFLKTEPPELTQAKDLMDQVNAVHKAMTTTAHRGAARRPQAPTHNGFGMDAYEPYQPLPKIWSALNERLTSMVGSSAAWQEAFLKKQKEVRAEAETLTPNSWYVREVADALANRLSDPRELGRRARLQRALEHGTVAMDSLAEAYGHSRIAGKNFDALLAVNLTAFDILKQALAHAQAGHLAEAEAAHRRAIDGFVKLGLMGISPQSSSGSGYGYTKRESAEELWMLLRVERLLMDVDRLIGDMKSKQYDANLAQITVELRGQNLQQVIVQLSDENGSNQPIDRNATGNRYTARVPAGTYTVGASAAGLRITPDTVTFALGNRATKNIVMNVADAVGGGSGSTQSILTALTRFNPTSRILAENFNVPEERPSFSLDGRTLVTNLSLDLVRYQISNSAAQRLIQEEGEIPYKLDAGRALGAVHPIVVGDSVVYRAGTTFYVPGHMPSPSIKLYMTVSLQGGKPIFLFDLPQYETTMVDARVRQEPEFLVAGELNGLQGWFILRGSPPDPTQAELLVDISGGYAETASVSRDWQVFATTTSDQYGQWTIFDQNGRILARTPKGDRWQTLTLGPKGKFFVAQHPDPDDGSAELVIAEVSQPNVYLPVYSGAINMGSMGWSADGRLLAGRVFHEGRPVQLRLFDLFGGTGSKPTPYTFDPDKKVTQKDQRPSNEEDQDTQVSRDTQALYDTYIEAYNALTSLMAAGRGDTPEAQEAYAKYQEAKRIYEAALQNNPEIESH